ncbi:MAG TPA: hypothetical protein V6D14_35150 [Coleofasciculaceae cyanobacterium]|jgi:hypothetical protein
MKSKSIISVCQMTTIALAAMISSFPIAVFATDAKPDARGDYNAWASNWIVVINSGNLNCRSEPGTSYRILTKYTRASTLPTLSELEGDPIRRDRQGLPWVRIKWAGTGGSPCYIRANTSFIRSLDDFTIDQTACVVREIRKGRPFHDAAFGCVD